MAEIAGTAVGVLSLGIQVCQGLVFYFQAYKSQDEKILEFVQDASTLTNTLDSTQNCLSKLSCRQLDTLVQVQRSIVQCTTAIKRLDQLLGKCRQTGLPTDFKERIQLLTRKATFPFRQRTVQELREIVKGLQTTISVALQALQIELTHDLLDKASNISHIREDVSAHGTQLQNIHSFLPALKDGTRDVVQAIKQLPLIQQSSNRTADSVLDVGRSVLTLDQQVHALGNNIEQNVANWQRNWKDLPNLIENKMLAMLELHFRSQASVESAQCAMSDNTISQFNNPQMDTLRNSRLLRALCDQSLEIIGKTIPNEPSREPITRMESQNNYRLVAVREAPLASCSSTSSPATFESRSSSFGSLRLFWSSFASCTHHKYCPWTSQPRDQAISNTRYYFCALSASRILQCSLLMTRGAGGLSISPTLTFRSTVDRTSPAFALFRPWELIDKFSTKQNQISTPGAYYKWVAQELNRLFLERRASPSDMDEHGQTLAHAACVSFTRFPQFTVFNPLFQDGNNRSFAQEFKDLILSLRAWGVDLNESCCSYGNLQRPLDYMVFWGLLNFRRDEELATVGVELLNIDLEFSDTWWLLRHRGLRWSHHDYTRQLAICMDQYRDVDEAAIGIQCGPLSVAVLQKSEMRVMKILQEFPDSVYEKNKVGHTPLHLAASWPAGCALLLDAGGKHLVNTPDSVGFLPLAYASYRKCVATVRLFLDADSAIHTDDPANGEDSDEPSCSHDMLRDAIISSTDEIAMCILQALIDRRRRLAAIAIQELGCRAHSILGMGKVLDANAALVYKLLKRLSAAVPQGLLVPSKWRTIYDALYKGLRGDDQDTYTVPLRKWANIFSDAGFSVLDSDEHGRNLVAVLAIEIERPMSFWREDLAEISGYYSCILGKGVALEQRNWRPTPSGNVIPHTPAALYVGRQMSLRLFARHLNDPPYLLTRGSKIIKKAEVRQLLMQVVNTKTMDDCVCACSLGGCCAITAMLRYIPFSMVFPTSSAMDESRIGFALWLVELLDITNEGWKFVVANIIQFLTFQRLELTHTCCKYNRHTALFDIFDDDDRTEIQEEESEGLAQLASLMSEFEHVYVDQGVLPSRFLEGYWTTRMDEVMSKNGDRMDEGEVRQIRELGVVLKPDDGA